MPSDLLRTLTNDKPVDVMLGDLVLPVPPRRMRIRQTAKVDEIDVPNRNGKVKQAVGYESAEISLQLEVCDREVGGAVVETAKERVETLTNLFKPEQTAVPKVVPIVSELTELFRVRDVLIRDIEVVESADFGHYDVTLTLTEFASEENTAATGASGDGSTGGSTGSADGSGDGSAGSSDPATSALERGYQDGHGFAPFQPGVDHG